MNSTWRGDRTRNSRNSGHNNKLRPVHDTFNCSTSPQFRLKSAGKGIFLMRAWLYRFEHYKLISAVSCRQFRNVFSTTASNFALSTRNWQAHRTIGHVTCIFASRLRPEPDTKFADMMRSLSIRDRPKPKFWLSAETEYSTPSKWWIFCRNWIFCRIPNILLNAEYSAKMPDIWHLNCKFSDI